MSQSTIDISTATAALNVVDDELAEVEAENEQLRRQLQTARGMAQAIYLHCSAGAPDAELSESMKKWRTEIARWETEPRTDDIDDWRECARPVTQETT